MTTSESNHSEIGDAQRLRKLFKSMTTANPTFAPGWISAARSEESDGKISNARKIIREGCKQCPKNEDVWLEAIR